MHGLHFRIDPEALCGQMGCSPDTNRGEVESTRLGRGGGDEIANCLEALRRETTITCGEMPNGMTAAKSRAGW